MNPFLCHAIYFAIIGATFLLDLALRHAAPGRDGARYALWIAGALAAGAFTWTITEPRHALLADYYKAYHPAGEAVLAGGSVLRDRMTELIASRDFVNIPVVALLFAPLAALGLKGSGIAFTILGISATVGAWALLVRMSGMRRWQGVVFLCLFLANGPLYYSFGEGNTTHMILFLLALALWLVGRGREFAAGLLLGVAAIVKLPLMLFGIFYLIQRRWRIVAGGALAIGIACALSVAMFGLEMNQLWKRECVDPFSGRPMPAYNVQSIDGFLVRFYAKDIEYSPGDPWLLRYWDPLKTEKWHKYGRLPLLFGLVGFAFWATLRGPRRRDDEPGGMEGGPSDVDAADFALVLALAFVTSPVSWSHYYVLMLLPLAFYMGGRLGPLCGDRLSRGVALTSIVLISPPVVVLEPSAPWLAAITVRTLTSHYLFGGLLVVALLLRARWAMGSTALAKTA